MTDLGDRLVASLAAAGIGAIFGVPGGQTLPLYRAARGSSLRHVLMRDERAAACAADAYARVTGGVGACDATVGPGATNLVSGLAEAYSSSIPVLAVVADIRTDQEHLRRGGVVSQAIDQRAFLAPVTKWVARVQRADSFDDVLAHALRVATTGRPGPVALEIPDDVFSSAPVDQPVQLTPADARAPRFRPAPSAVDVRRVLALLASGERPLILAGGGVVMSRAGDALVGFAEATGTPVATTIMGKGSIPERHPLALGAVGTFGCVRATAALLEADVVLVLGSKLDQMSTVGFRIPGRSQRIAHVDLDGEEIGRVTPVDVGVVADARAALLAFHDALDVVPVGDRSPWIATLPAEPSSVTSADDPRIAPEAVVDTINRRAPDGHVFVSDASLASGWSARFYQSSGAGRTYLAPRGLAGIGWAGGAAIGAAIASGAPVVALAGDGAWGYTMAEVETAARLRLPITFVILNNAAFGWITHVEHQMQLTELSRLANADYALAGQAMGAASARVTSLDVLDGELVAAADRSGPTVIEVLSSADASPTLRIRDVRRHSAAIHDPEPANAYTR